MDHMRTRWAALGAAVAVTLGAGGLGVARATTDSGPMPIFILLDEPCRLADTRPAPDTIGPRATPLGFAETYELDGWGDTGDCSLPTDTAALSLNVTAVGASDQTNLRFFPQGVDVPATANLNPTPGAPPTPNAVNVALNATTGQFSIFNAFGSVDAVIDVIGYYDDHLHTGDDIVDGSLDRADIGDESGIVMATLDGTVKVEATAEPMISTGIRVPADGWVRIEVTGEWINGGTGATGSASCQFQLGTPGTIDADGPRFRLDPRGADVGQFDSFSAHRIVEIAVADNPTSVLSGQTLSLVCDGIVDGVFLGNLHLTGTYYSTSYAPLSLVLASDESE